MLTLSPQQRIGAAPSAAQEWFAQGNYAAVARAGDPDDWRTYAALGLIGKPREALDGLARFDGDGPAFYAAVTRWIEGDDDGAAVGLEPLAPFDEHARKLLELIRRPRIRVLAQLAWSRSGCSDLLGGIRKQSKFQVENVSFHPHDRPNAPYADVHRLYDTDRPPDFYVCQMVEWHFLPPNLGALPCPLIGHTADYDLHVQAVHPWLQLFDELVVTDPSEWRDVRDLAPAPVSTFPKSFGLPDSLPPASLGRRAVDLFLSGTVAHPYHPDKATLLHQILRTPGLHLRVLNGFRGHEEYLRSVSRSKLCVTYVRHPTATPTRGLEALALGCALVVQEGSVLTLFAGEGEGVLTYDLEKKNLPSAIREVVENWPAYRKRAARGSAVIRREFAMPRVASQYLRFLTFLAARPRGRRKAAPDGLVQKRPVLQCGWLPEYDFDSGLVLKRVGRACHARFMEDARSDPPASRPFIDAARESVLYNFHRVRNGLLPCGEWLDSVSPVYRGGLARFPSSLPLRFNFIRVLLHFGDEERQAEGLRLLDEGLARPADEWDVDPMEDVFPWDFFPRLFNYRAYFDRVTVSLSDGRDPTPDLRRLLLASLHSYRGFFAAYRDFDSGASDCFRRAAALDPAFPYYRFHLAEELLRRGLPEDDAEAVGLLRELLEGSIVFHEAFDLLDGLADGVRPGGCRSSRSRGRTPEPSPELRDLLDAHRGVVSRARAQVEFVERVSPGLNRRDLRLRGGARGRAARRRLRARIRQMESSKFWKLRGLWLRVKRLFGLGGGAGP